MSSKPSAFKSPTLTPQGQYVSTPSRSENLGELPAAQVLVEGVAKDVVRGALQIGLGPLDGAEGLALGFLHLDPKIERLDGLAFGHIGVHVGDVNVHQAVLIEVEELHAHCAPGGLREIGRRLVDEAFVALVFVVMIVPLHVHHVEVGESVLVQIGKCGVAAPTAVAQIHLLRDVLEFAASQVPPKLVGAQLCREIDVHHTIAIHVGDRQAVSMIVMGGFVFFASVVHDLVGKSDPAFRDSIGELETVERLIFLGGGDLLFSPALQEIQRDGVIGKLLRAKKRNGSGEEAAQDEKKCRELAERSQQMGREGTPSYRLFKRRTVNAQRHGWQVNG